MNQEKTYKNKIRYIKLKNISIYLKYSFFNKTPVINCQYIKLESGKLNSLIGSSGSGKTLIVNLIIGNLNWEIFNITGVIEVLFENKKYIFDKYKNYVDFCSKMKKNKYFGLIPQSPTSAFSSLNSTKVNNFFKIDSINLINYFEIFLSKKEKINSKYLFNNLLKNLKIEINKPIEKLKHEDLSLGMKQRLLIAIFLYNKPSLVIGDEITSSLDVKNTISIMKMIKNYIKRNNAIFFLVTHDMTVAKNLTDNKYKITNKEVKKSFENE